MIDTEFEWGHTLYTYYGRALEAVAHWVLYGASDPYPLTRQSAETALQEYLEQGGELPPWLKGGSERLQEVIMELWEESERRLREDAERG